MANEMEHILWDFLFTFCVGVVYVNSDVSLCVTRMQSSLQGDAHTKIVCTAHTAPKFVRAL